MKLKRADHDGLEYKILHLLFDKAPNSVRVQRVYEILGGDGATKEQVDETIERLHTAGKLTIIERPKSGVKQWPAIESELEKRTAIGLPKYPAGMPIKGDYKIGNASVVRLLSGDIVSGEDINEVTEALKDYADSLDRRFDERVRKETAKIYRQMITIFGVFVSIFAIIVISTEKMIRFNVDVLQTVNPFELFWKSLCIFAPVGFVVFGLVWFVTRRSS